VALNEAESKRILADYGIVVPAEALARDEAAAVQAAARIGYPVVLKAVSATLTHKSDAGAVILGIADATALRAGIATIRRNLDRAGFAGSLDGFLVSEFVQGGLELVIGAQRDPEVGPVVMVGAGGVLLELIHDVAFGPAPLDELEATALIERLRIARLLHGYRGAPAHDIAALARAVVAVAELAADLGDDLVSIDVNPLLSRPGQNPVALDAVIVLR
jgi:acetate---CoA ligase (ADP-forming)